MEEWKKERMHAFNICLHTVYTAKPIATATVTFPYDIHRLTDCLPACLTD